jgi:hypothetical protein
MAPVDRPSRHPHLSSALGTGNGRSGARRRVIVIVCRNFRENPADFRENKGAKNFSRDQPKILSVLSP